MAGQLSTFSAIVFDMDGVLLDTETLYKEAMERACRDLGVTMTPELHFAQIGIPAEIGEQMMIDAFGPEFPLRDYNARVHASMLERLRHNVPVKDGALELLRELRRRNIPVAVATSTSSPTAPERLARAGLLDFLGALVTRSDVTHGKPHPEPFLTAAARLKVSPADCLAIEDSYNGIRAAHAAGMRPIMIPDLLPPHDDVTPLCHSIFHSLDHFRDAAFPLTGR